MRGQAVGRVVEQEQRRGTAAQQRLVVLRSCTNIRTCCASTCRPVTGLDGQDEKKKSGGRAQVAKHLNLHAYLPPFSRRLLPVPPPPGLGPPGHTWVSSASELPPPHPTAEDLRCWGWQASTPNSLACGAREEPESKEAYPPSRCAHLSVLAASKQDKAATHTGRRWRTLMYTPLASRRKTKASQVLLVTTRP